MGGGGGGPLRGKNPLRSFDVVPNLYVDERVQRQTGLWRRLEMLGQVLRTAVGRCHLLLNQRGPYNFLFLQGGLFIFRFFFNFSRGTFNFPIINF